MQSRLAVLFSLICFSLPAGADLVVVVNANNPSPVLTKEEVVRIFLGRYRQFPTGQGAEPYDQGPDSPERSLFYERLVGKTAAQINAYWARLIFTGRTRPPLVYTAIDQLVEGLGQNPNAIGYIDRSQVNRRLRIVYEVGQ